MSDKVANLMGGFLKKGGDKGDGIQIAVDARRLSDADPVERERGAGKGKKTKLACMGLTPSVLAKGSPRYKSALQQANKYRKIRMRELAELHGHVSAGVGAMLSSSSLALAASRFLYELFAETGSDDISILKEAAKMADSARQQDLAAWEVCAREGVLKRRQEASEDGMPWLLNKYGEPLQKGGRKTNAQRQEREMDVHDRPVVDSHQETEDAGQG